MHYIASHHGEDYSQVRHSYIDNASITPDTATKLGRPRDVGLSPPPNLRATIPFMTTTMPYISDNDQSGG